MSNKFHGGNKYCARKVSVFGMQFDSKAEADHYLHLLARAKAGEIEDIRRQVRYELIPAQKSKHRNERPCDYIADFVYKDIRTGEEVVEDVKGYKAGEAFRIYVIKRKLMLYRYGISVREVSV